MPVENYGNAFPSLASLEIDKNDEATSPTSFKNQEKENKSPASASGYKMDDAYQPEQPTAEESQRQKE
jgi:hypothetical protein